jgi:hypothetical protein
VNLGAVVGSIMDARERHAFFLRLQRDDVGFRAIGKDSACWLWRFSLAPLKADIDAPTGTAVALTGLLGIPFARLRCAIPDEVGYCPAAVFVVRGGSSHTLPRAMCSLTV